MTRFRLLPIFLSLLAGCSDGSSAQRLHLLAMGDWGNNSPRQREMASVLADYADRQNPPVDAMLLAGDNFYIKLTGIDDPRWQEVFEQMYDPRTLNFPFYVALGNHDYSEGLVEMELEYSRVHPESRWKLPARWYRLDMPANDPIVTILMLDSDRTLMGDALWNEELAWIRDELSKPRATWTVCVAHHPLFSNGDHGDNGVLQKVWGPMFKKYAVDFYIAGHDHDVQHLRIPGWTTDFLLVGGGGATTRPMRQDNREHFSKSQHGFGDLRFSPARAAVRLLDGRGEVSHEFTRDRSGRMRILRTTPSDVAVPRTPKSITRGGQDAPATVPAQIP